MKQQVGVHLEAMQAEGRETEAVLTAQMVEQEERHAAELGHWKGLQTGWQHEAEASLLQHPIAHLAALCSTWQQSVPLPALASHA